jgi:hypothetical protein
VPGCMSALPTLASHLSQDRCSHAVNVVMLVLRPVLHYMPLPAVPS